MFTKSDLRSGDIIKRRNGSVEILILPLGVLITKDNGWNNFDSIQEDLVYTHYAFGITNPNYDIVEVRRPTEKFHCRHCAFLQEFGTLIYSRDEAQHNETSDQQRTDTLSDIEESEDMGRFLSSFSNQEV